MLRIRGTGLHFLSLSFHLLKIVHPAPPSTFPRVQYNQSELLWNEEPHKPLKPQITQNFIFPMNINMQISTYCTYFLQLYATNKCLLWGYKN